MTNRWNIPPDLEREISKRDKTCVYCGIRHIDKVTPGVSRKAIATWEHIINDARIITRENIARCCFSCNASKGAKKLSEWINSEYCKKREINEATVADVIKVALRNGV